MNFSEKNNSITLTHPTVKDNVSLPPSKSQLHRMIICGLQRELKISGCGGELCDDVKRTLKAVKNLGAETAADGDTIKIYPQKKIKANAVIDCGESASTLRMLLPAAACFSPGTEFLLSTSLAKRPRKFLLDSVISNGAAIENRECLIKVLNVCDERMNFFCNPSFSSQAVSGFCLLPTEEKIQIKLTDKPVSLPYIKLTLDILSSIGKECHFDGDEISVKSKNTGGSVSLSANPDSSAAIYPLLCGILGDKPVFVNVGAERDGIDFSAIELLKTAGAKIELNAAGIMAYPSKLSAFNISVADMPDALPCLAIAAASANGTSIIYDTDRLRGKESDRVSAVCDLINSLGGKAEAGSNIIKIYGKDTLYGGNVNTHSDHRIAMAAACAAVCCEGSVTIDNPGCINKSFPGFFEAVFI